MRRSRLLWSIIVFGLLIGSRAARGQTIYPDGRIVVAPAKWSPPKGLGLERLGRRGDEVVYLTPRVYEHGEAVAGLVNNSLAGADGFTDPGLTARRAAIHVAARGNDAAPGTPERPVRTIRAALAAAQARGAGVLRLRRGDAWGVGFDRLPAGKPGAPFVVESYWNAADGPDPQRRPRIVVPPEANAITSHPSAKTPPRSDIVLRGLELVRDGDPTGGDGKGIVLRACTRLVIDDCIVRRFATNLGLGECADVTLMNSTLADATAGKPHSQGLFAKQTDRLLISRSAIVHCGWHGADGTRADIYSHNAYIQRDCGAVIVWGSVLAEGGSHGIQLRSGGIVAYSYLPGNAWPMLIAAPGGAVYRVVVEGTRDIAEGRPGGWAIEIGNREGNRGNPVAVEVDGLYVVRPHTRRAPRIAAINVGKGSTAVVRRTAVLGNRAVVSGNGQVEVEDSGVVPAAASRAADQHTEQALVDRLRERPWGQPPPDMAALWERYHDAYRVAEGSPGVRAASPAPRAAPPAGGRGPNRPAAPVGGARRLGDRSG
jgi:hypothetical protein